MTLTDPQALVATRPEELPDDAGVLKHMVLELLASLVQERKDKDAYRHQLAQALRRLYGPRTERIDPRQLLLFAPPAETPAAGTLAAAVGSPEPQARAQRRCRPHGRRRLPDHLPREERHHRLTEAERLCRACGQVRVDIGVDASERLEYRPASLHVIRHLVHKYACRCCGRETAAAGPGQGPAAQESKAMPPTSPEPPPPAGPASHPEPLAADPAPTAPRQESPAAGQESQARPTASPGPAASADPASHPEPTGPVPARIAPCPEESCGTGQAADPAGVVIAGQKPRMPIDKGLPGPGLLAHLIVSKFTDHLPLHRLERIYARQGVFLHRSTLCDWLGACADLLWPLYQRMIAVVLQSRSLHTDDTPVKMQERGTHVLVTARLWAYLGDEGHRYNVFDFTVTRKRDGPQKFLKEYQGYLHADAFSGYDGLYLPEAGTGTARVIEVACNAHARRKFYEARGTDDLRAHQALAYYAQLYELERAAKDFSDEQRLAMRQDLSRPILETFHVWLAAQRSEVLPKSPMAEAIGYALNNWAALTRYTEAGFLDIDNNAAEREMKRVAIGRKNWLTIGSPRGGMTAAVLMSFTSTCQRLGVEPWAYLSDVLARLPELPPEPGDDLLPDRWQAARSDQAPSGPPIPPPTAGTPS